MKKISYSLYLLLASVHAFGQIFIAGEVKNVPKDAEVEITYYNNTIEWTEVSAAKVKPDSEGNFKTSFTLSKALPAQLTIAEQYTNLFLIPCDSIHITLDYNKFDETIHYTGRGSADNNYLAAEMLAKFTSMANRYSAFNDADQFKLYIDSLEKLNNELLKAHISEFSNEFRNYITISTKYRFINPRWMYKVGYDRAAKKFFDKPVPENYFDFLKDLNLDDEQAFDNANYNVALIRYLSEMHDSKLKIPDSLTDMQKRIFRIKQCYDYRKSIFKNKVRDYQLTEYLKNEMNTAASDARFASELMKDYRATCKTPEYVAIIDNLYTLAIKLSPGNSAPGFTLLDMDGKSLSLSSLKGKIVFIDFWATWCVPCISAMPKTHQLMEKFKERNDVVFLNINVKDDITRWKTFVAKETMPGVN